MDSLSPAVRGVVEGRHLAHLVTVNPDGSPQVTVVWSVSTATRSSPPTSGPGRRSRTSARSARSVVSIETGLPGPHGLDEYLVLHGTARVTEGGAPELLQRLAGTYIGPDGGSPRWTILLPASSPTSGSIGLPATGSGERALGAGSTPATAPEGPDGAVDGPERPPALLRDGPSLSWATPRRGP